MLKTRRIPIVLALLAGGFVLLAAALTASAAPNAALTYPGPAPCNTTLQACIDGANVGDQITIAPNTYITSLLLSKAVSLTGANVNTTLLKAPAGQRALLVSGAAVTPATLISNLTIQGDVLASGNGAGVLVMAGAQPTLQNLVIQSGTVSATTAFGGGLFTESSLTLTNVTFFQNVAYAGRGGGLGGSPSAHLNLINVTFNSNGADQGGGGLFANSASITGSTFIFNVAGFTGHGGGAFLTSTVAVTNSTFTQNEAHELGGGLFAGGNATLSGGTFRSNVSVGENGGALVVGGNLLLNGTVITGSQSFDSGGAIFVTGTTTLNNALIAQNRTTGGAGGGLRAVGAVHISNTQFISNTSFNQGGGLRVNAAIFLTNTTFMSNTSGVGGGTSRGGGVYANAAATMTGGGFIANSADLGGGVKVDGSLVLSGTLFRGNTAGVEGGGLDVITATVQNATFDQNKVLAGNGGGLAAANVLSITRSIFTQNAVISGTQANATGGGGGIFGDGVVTSTDNVFIGNFALRQGGGMDVDDVTSIWDQFRGNVTGPAGLGGGGMFVSGLLDLDGGLFFTNTANSGGGLGLLSDVSGNVYNSLFVRNVVTSADGGAAMRLANTSSMFVTHNTIVGPSVPITKPAIFMVTEDAFSFYNNLITHHSQGIKNNSAGSSTEDYNIFFAVSTPLVGAFDIGANTLTVDPLFVNPAADDYHLSFNSPAIDNGYFFNGLNHDFEGQPRPMGNDWDRGFDEALPARIFLPVLRR